MDNGNYAFAMALSKNKLFKFVDICSPLGQKLYRKFNLPRRHNFRRRSSRFEYNIKLDNRLSCLDYNDYIDGKVLNLSVNNTPTDCQCVSTLTQSLKPCWVILKRL